MPSGSGTSRADLIKTVATVVFVVVAAGTGALLLSRSEPGEEGGGKLTQEPDATMTALRARVLHGTIGDYSIEPVNTVWGVLMETGYGSAAATLVALGDGSASIYFSSGGGVIGGGPDPAINRAARQVVQIAAQHLSEMSQASEFPLPEDGQTVFYVLTTNGVLKAGAPEEVLGMGGHPLSVLFRAGHEVIGGLRVASEKAMQEKER